MPMYWSLVNVTLFVCLLTIIPIGSASAQSSDYIYWGEPTKIRRANLDGTEAMDICGCGIVYGFGITLDLTNNHIYWTDNYLGPSFRISRANLDGSNPQVLLPNGHMGNIPVAYDIALDLTNSYIYYPYGAPTTIWRANLDGTGAHSRVTTAGIATYYRSEQ